MAKNDQYIFGLHAVLEALQAGKEIDKVLVRHGSTSDQMKRLLGELNSRDIPIQRVPVEKLNRITQRNHQGVVAWISPISYSQITHLIPSIYEAGEDPFILILDGVSDVRNFGAIARSAECAGAHALVIPVTGSAAIHADAIKTSAGALHRIPVCRVRDLAATVKFLRESGLRLVAATEKTSTSIYQTDMTGPVGIIMGSEENGISPELLMQADHLATIPMSGRIASLNVSVAAGILLFEVLRQRGA
jgi:23S rRNA (guanosine2251-2'-O)-methyltransferase